MAEKFNKNQREGTLDVGQRVLISTNNIETGRPSKKIDYRWYGPYSIKEKITDTSYRVALPKTWKIHDVFHLDHIKPFIEDAHGRAPPCVKLIVRDAQTLEAIREHRIDPERGSELLIKWDGKPESAMNRGIKPLFGQKLQRNCADKHRHREIQ
jgi:hypothetical protein